MKLEKVSVRYGMALLDRPHAMPDGVTRQDLIRYLQRSGVAMGQETHVVRGVRVPADMIAAG